MSSQSPTFEDQIADVIVNAVKLAVAPLKARIAALEAKADGTGARDYDARIKALEDRPALRYGGVYESGVTYREGTLVTRSGGLWLALKDTSRQPGTAPDDWRLVVKSGGA